MSKRVIKTVDDAMRAIADLQPDGFSVYFEVRRGLSRETGRTWTSIEFRVYGFKDGCNVHELPEIKAHTPYEIVRKFIDEWIPLTRPKPATPPGPVRGHMKGKRTLRLTHEPSKPFRPAELFGND